MQKFILNNKLESKDIQEKAIVQSFKSKLAVMELKLEEQTQQNLTLKTETATLMKNELNLNEKLQQLCAEKDLLHNECVKMSQHIFEQQHERRRYFAEQTSHEEVKAQLSTLLGNLDRN